MINSTLLIQKKTGLMLLALVLTVISYGASFTANTSGNFSSTSTWAGGVIPSSTDLLDSITISPGVTVMLDNNLTINGLLAWLNVQGTLNTSNSSSLTINLGTLTGAGTIALNTVDINVSSTVSFTGSLTANTLNSATGFSTSADVIVGQTLNLTNGTLSLVSGGSLDVSNNGTIVVSGGLLSLGIGGSLGLTGNYNVNYTSISSIAGIELSGSGLQNVTVNVNGVSSVTLTADLTVAGTLSLASGTLVLAGNDLTINGAIAASGSGTVSSTIASNINFNTAGGTTGTITFGGATPTVNNLTVNVGAGNQAHIAGTVTVAGTVQLNSGTLNFNGATLIISGNIAGSGSLIANSMSNLTISTLTGAASTLSFVSGGQSIHDLTIAVAAINAPILLSDLTVTGALTLTGVSNIVLNGYLLTLGANSNVSGTGSIVATSTSALTIDATGGVSSLMVSGTIGNLTVNSGGSNVTLGSNLSTSGMLTLQSGSLVLAGHDLAISGDVAAAGSGTISSDSTSDLFIATATSTTGSLSFSSVANTVGNLGVNIGTSGSAAIASNLNVADTLRFLAGSLNIGSNALVIGSLGTITGAGASSYVMTAAAGYVQMGVTAGAIGSVSFPVGTSTYYAPANIHLNTGSASGQIQVGVVNNVLAQGTTGVDLSATQSLVDATWNVHSNITSNLNLNLEVLWSAAMQVNGFNSNAAYVSHYVNGSWNTSAPASATTVGSMFSLQTTGLTSLSPFSVFDQNTVTAVNEISDAVIFVVYPNPVADNLTIQNSTASAESVNMDIYSATGQLMSSSKLTNSTSTVSVKQFVNGTYFIRFYNSKMSNTKSFVKM